MTPECVSLTWGAPHGKWLATEWCGRMTFGQAGSETLVASRIRNKSGDGGLSRWVVMS